MKTGSTNLLIFDLEDRRNAFGEFTRRVSEEPLNFSAFINALLFLCHTSGLKLFLGGRVLLRPSSNTGLHSRYLLQPSTNAGPLPSSSAGMYPSSNAGLCTRAPTPDCISELQRRNISELQRRTVSRLQCRTMYLSSNARVYSSSNAGLYPRCHKSPWFKEVEGI